MRTLSFDTSTSSLHICLAERTDILVERTLHFNADDRQFAASSIIPSVVQLLKEVGWQKSDLELIVVGIGPGSFTGIRIAVVTARGLAQALNLPLIGINAFECVAFKEQPQKFPAAIMFSAGKRQFYCAHVIDNNLPIQGQNIVNSNQKSLYWNMNFHHLLADDLSAHLEEFQVVYGPPNTDEQNELELNHAVYQAILASQRLNQMIDDSHNLATILAKMSYQFVKPLYIRNASVTIKSSA